jgi:SAM-dependent methyltransferase
LGGDRYRRWIDRRDRSGRRQRGAGAGLARNKGIELARFDNLLFLDADDFIFPAHLTRLSELLADDPQLDAVVCGWAHVTPAGELVFEQREGEQGDLFRAHAQYCYSLIHTYLTRRSVVERAGGFDPAFETCEDWDLFQRIARAGARFGRVSEVLAGYRMRAGSATRNVKNLLRDGLAVIKNGHGPDGRVGQPHPVYADGLPAREFSLHAYGHACNCAGYLLGAGLGANSTLDPLPDPPPDALTPVDAANAIFVHAMIAAACPMADWTAVWRRAQPQLRSFLSALESRMSQPGFASKTRLIGNYLLQRSIGTAPVGTLTGATLVAASRLTGKLRATAKATRRAALATFRSTPLLEQPGLRLRRMKAARQPAAEKDTETLFEALFRSGPDPWDYENAYETTKLRQALDLLPDLSCKHALELGCAEGHASRHIARRVKHLHATDVSTTALERAARRCEDLSNVTFGRLDLMTDPVRGPYDLIVCSEILYYCRHLRVLRQVARRIASGLRSGGYLLMTHANVLIDDPENLGFDWEHSFGAKVIGEVFARTRGLTMLREARAPLYRIHLLQRSGDGHWQPAVERLSMAEPLPAEIVAQVRNGASWNLPILTYSPLARHDVFEQADCFGEQMRELYAQGYRTQPLETWKNARDFGVPIAGKALHIVLDQPGEGLAAKAQALLAELAFTTTCILTVDPLRGRLVLRTMTESPVPLPWRKLRRLQAAGMRFGVRIDDGIWKQNRSTFELVRLLTRARNIASAEGAAPVTVFRAPGSVVWTRRLQWIAGVCGFEFALCARSGVATRSDRLLALPTVAASVSGSPGDLLARLNQRPGGDIA